MNHTMRPTPNMLLLLVDGSSQHETVISHSPFTIGRLPDKDIVLPYSYISRSHAEIVYEGDQFHLIDCGSRSGCYVNGKRVDRHALTTNDVIHIGSLQGPLIRFGRPNDTTSALRGLLHQMQPASDLEKLRWFLEAARKLNGVGAVHEILISLIETTLQLTGVERGYVFLKDATGKLRLAVGRNTKREPLEDDATIAHSAIQQAIRSSSEFIVTDTLAADAGSRSDSVVAQNIRSIICIPLRKHAADLGQEEREILGILYLDSRKQRGRMMGVDSDLLKTVATEAAVLVENASLAREEEAARRYREELVIAAEIQQGLMTVRIPQLPYARVQAHSVPCKEIGGDFYDVVATDRGLYAVIADISGKGVSAALLGSTLQGMVHAQILAGQPLPQIAMFANRYICDKNIQKYATMVLLELTPEGEVEYVNCGHVQPLRHMVGGIDCLSNGNLPIGLMPTAAYSSETIRIAPGERIFLFTDGVTEAEDPEGEFYGDARLQASILAGASVGKVLEQVQSFTRGAPSNDDCTLLEICFGACS